MAVQRGVCASNDDKPRRATPRHARPAACGPVGEGRDESTRRDATALRTRTPMHTHHTHTHVRVLT